MQQRARKSDPIEGEFYLVKSKNYQAFLAAIGSVNLYIIVIIFDDNPGCGPLSANMVMRARVILRIKQVVEYD